MNEQKANALQEATVLVDNYSLMNQTGFLYPHVETGNMAGGKDKSFASLDFPGPS